MVSIKANSIDLKGYGLYIGNGKDMHKVVEFGWKDAITKGGKDINILLNTKDKFTTLVLGQLADKNEICFRGSIFIKEASGSGSLEMVGKVL